MDPEPTLPDPPEATPPTPGKAPKKDSLRKVFFHRMERDGRAKEWYDRVRKTMKDTGKPYGAIVFEVMRQMGYETPEKEWEIHREWQKTSHLSAGEVEKRKMISELRAERATMSFETIVTQLPAKAPPAVELDWIRTHPAMTRKERSSGDKRIILSVDDLFENGDPPSRGAVQQLQHWANHPHDFFKILLSESKKKTDEGGDGDDPVEDPGLSQIERMLQEVSIDV
jgi:hypothetical protein